MANKKGYNKKTSKMVENQVIKDYLDNKPVKEILFKNNISETLMYLILRKNNINRKGYDRFKYSVDKNYFDNIDHQNKAYWLGMLAADGNNRINLKIKQYILNLGLKKIDKKLLKKYK